MKLIMAIISHDDAQIVIQNLMKEGYYVTKLATTGGFLRAGNVTILVGVENEKADAAIGVITKFSHSRKQVIPTTSELGMGFYPATPVEVTVGGATIFVMDVERFDKI